MASRILMVVLVLITLAAVGIAVFLAMRPAAPPATVALVRDPANPGAPATVAVVTQASGISSNTLSLTPQGAAQRMVDDRIASIAEGLGDFAR